MRWLCGVLLSVLVAVSCGCAGQGADEGSQTTSATPLDLDEAVVADLGGGRSPRHRYLVRIGAKGRLTLRMSWNDQEGVDRVLIQGGTITDAVVVDARNQLKIEPSLEIAPGYYYVEIIPGRVPVTYNLVALFVRS